MKDKQVKCETCGDVLVYSTCNGCARRDYDGMRDFQKKYIDCDHERRELLRQLDEAIKAGREAKRLLIEHGYHPQAEVITQLDKITIMKMNPIVQKEAVVQKEADPGTGRKSLLGVIFKSDPDPEKDEKEKCQGPHKNPGMKGGKLMCMDCGFPV